MDIKTFMNNIRSIMGSDDEKELNAIAYKTKNNIEIRVFNVEFNDILVISNDGSTTVLNVDEFIEK